MALAYNVDTTAHRFARVTGSNSMYPSCAFNGDIRPGQLTGNVVVSPGTISYFPSPQQ